MYFAVRPTANIRIAYPLNKKVVIWRENVAIIYFFENLKKSKKRIRKFSERFEWLSGFRVLFQTVSVLFRRHAGQFPEDFAGHSTVVPPAE